VRIRPRTFCCQAVQPREPLARALVGRLAQTSAGTRALRKSTFSTLPVMAVALFHDTLPMSGRPIGASSHRRNLAAPWVLQQSTDSHRALVNPRPSPGSVIFLPQVCEGGVSRGYPPPRPCGTSGRARGRTESTTVVPRIRDRACNRAADVVTGIRSATWTRTRNLPINSRLLCQLSHSGLRTSRGTMPSSASQDGPPPRHRPPGPVSIVEASLLGRLMRSYCSHRRFGHAARLLEAPTRWDFGLRRLLEAMV
jgi:hypothetical protein